jgi:hypothetical protein
LASLYGISSGIAQLDASGKIQVANLPSVVMQYQGAWTPSTNTPTLSDAGCTTSTNGNVYYVSAAFASTVAGLTDATMTGFQKGNLIICSSSISKWQQVAPASGVQSVNGAQGAVVLTQGNLTAAGVDGIAVTGGTNAVWGTGTSVAQQAATTSTNGYLKSVDWNTFNGKQAALTFSGALQNSSNTVTALFDNATIGVNGSNQLFVKNSGIGTAQITSGASANGTVLTANGSGGVSFASVPTSAPTVSGTFASPNLITAAVGVPFSSSAAVAVVYVAGNAGAVTVTAATQIAAGSVNGQHLTVMGTSATNTVKLSDGNGLFLNGPWTGGASSALSLVWDSGSSLWREISRSN